MKAGRKTSRRRHSVASAASDAERLRRYLNRERSALKCREEEIVMVALKKPPAIAAEVVCDPSVMSGEPVVRGTRVPAETIVAYLRAGRSKLEIFEDYPTLPVDGIEAVVDWAEKTLGPSWRAPDHELDG
jgi:uncharacterized protein (DUF433 family)